MNDQNNGGPQGPEHQGPQQPQYPQYGQQGNPQPGFSQQPPQGYAQQPLLTPQQQARQQKLYEQAQKKANRSWFQKKRFLFPIGAAVLIGIINIGGGGNNEAPVAGIPASSAPAAKAPATEKAKADAKEAEDATEKEEAEKPAAPAASKIGDKVVAGDWEFTVTKFKCGFAKVGNEYLDKTAQGQFCKMNIEVKNNGKKEETLDGSNQKLFDSEGREFSSDTEASLYDDTDSTLFLEGINPGNTAKGVVIFDVPEGAKIIKTEMAGGFFGLGDIATVDLS